MPTKINGQLMVRENLSTRRIWIAKCFGLFLKLHDVIENKEMRLKASIIAKLDPITDAEVQAQKDAQERDRKAREEAKKKMEEDRSGRRMVTPAPVIPSNRYHK